VHVVNSTDTHADIATDHMHASNVVANTIVGTARKAGIPQQTAHFVAETIRQTIKDASAITTSSETETPTETLRPSKPLNPRRKPITTPLSIAPHFNNNTYAPIRGQ